MNVRFKINDATAEDILLHLKKCNSQFVPALDKKVILNEYASKIRGNAVSFEAWDEMELVGLIAVYFNDLENTKGFITSVSSTPGYSGQGIASKLLEQCIDYGKEKGFKKIALKVAADNRRAISLYHKQGFSEMVHKDGEILMEKNI